MRIIWNPRVWKPPRPFDDLYEILKAYKADYPDSYPLTILAGPRVLFRMTMPSFGISFGKSSSSGTGALSYDYEKGEYFEGCISEEAREYLRFMNKLYAEGLLDPEMAAPIDATYGPPRWQRRRNGYLRLLRPDRRRGSCQRDRRL